MHQCAAGESGVHACLSQVLKVVEIAHEEAAMVKLRH